MHFDAFLRSNPLHRFHEAQPHLLLHEGEDVPLLAALEAVVALIAHREIGILAVMKRTRAAKAAAHALEPHELADDRHDVRLVAYTFDDVVRNHANSASVTPAPPSFQAPSRNCFTRVSLRSISVTRSRNAPVPLP